jgi:Kef-type K+ transport system membrane component KefB
MGLERRKATLSKIRPLIQSVLLPAYFLAPGLVINFRSIGISGLANICGMVVLASAGKIGGASLASRASGLSWRQAGIVGALMNARGLVELVVLQIGFAAGLLSARLFGELIATALITTMMTGPLLDVVANGLQRRPDLDLPAVPGLVGT